MGEFPMVDCQIEGFFSWCKPQFWRNVEFCWICRRKTVTDFGLLFFYCIPRERERVITIWNLALSSKNKSWTLVGVGCPIEPWHLYHGLHVEFHGVLHGCLVAKNQPTGQCLWSWNVMDLRFDMCSPDTWIHATSCNIVKHHENTIINRYLSGMHICFFMFFHASFS